MNSDLKLQAPATHLYYHLRIASVIEENFGEQSQHPISKPLND